MNTSALDLNTAAWVVLIGAIALWHGGASALMTRLELAEIVKCERGLTSVLSTLTQIITGTLTTSDLMEQLHTYNLSLKPVPDEVSQLKISRAGLGVALSSAFFLNLVEVLLEGQVQRAVLGNTVRAAYFWLSTFSIGVSIICSVATVGLACRSDWRGGIRSLTTGRA